MFTQVWQVCPSISPVYRYLHPPQTMGRNTSLFACARACIQARTPTQARIHTRTAAVHACAAARSLACMCGGSSTCAPWGRGAAQQYNGGTPTSPSLSSASMYSSLSARGLCARTARTANTHQNIHTDKGGGGGGMSAVHSVHTGPMYRPPAEPSTASRPATPPPRPLTCM